MQQARNGRDRSAPQEAEEFPILCETCLGPNPFVRMTKEPCGKACKICDRPFCVYRWQPGPKARYKKTELCRTCAKIKNVCQTCVLDLNYGLPVQVRDAALDESDRVKLPDSDVGRGVMLEQLEGKMLEADSVLSQFSKPNAMLESMSRRTPYYKRNLAHLCSFYARGACNRGTLCPYRHEMPLGGELAVQNIKDRYHGHNDPVAAKMMRRHAESQTKLTAPEDTTICTLWVGNLQDQTSETDLRQKFQAFGDVASVRMIEGKQCAFVTYTRRAAAEEAAIRLYNNLHLHGSQVKISWGLKAKSSVSAPPGMSKDSAAGGAAAEGRGGKRQKVQVDESGFASIPSGPPPPGMGPSLYPSQDPHHNAAKFR